jgi:tetratricopeptide (TPR) repeat protein
VAEGLRQQGKLNEAIEILQKATEIDPENAQAWSLLGGIYNETNSEKAIRCYEKGLTLNRRYYLAYRGLGNYYLKKNNYSLAEEYYSKAININPYRFGPIYKNRAIARMQLGNNKGAKEDLVKYLELTPSAEDRKSIQEALNQF